MKKVQAFLVFLLMGVSITAIYFVLNAAQSNLDNRSQAAGTANSQISFVYGGAADSAVMGDWTKKGFKTPAIVRNNGTTWIEKNSNTTGYGDQTITLTLPASVTNAAKRSYLACDFTGNGISTPGVFANGYFYIRTTNTSGTPDLVFPFGLSTDTPLCGDWTGSGKQTVGLFRNGTWYLKNANSTGYADKSFNYGLATDVPVVGKWLGGNTDLPGLFRAGTFYLRYSLSTGNADAAVQLGQAKDVPLAGNWTGTGSDSVGVFRLGQWILNTQPNLLPSPSPISTPTPFPTPSLLPSPSPTPLPPSGQAMPVGDYTNPTTNQHWHQVFTDDFNTPVPLGSFPAAVSSKWTAYPAGWKDYSGNGTYDPSKVVSIQNGMMLMNLHTENGVHYVAAPEPIIPGAPPCSFPANVAPYQPCGIQYGRFAIRFKADPTLGFGTAWLLWPNSDNQIQDGEVDFPEGNLDTGMLAYMHHSSATNPHDQDQFPPLPPPPATLAPYNTWHTAVTEWTPSYIKFYLDGQLVGTSTSRLPASPMRWVLQTQTDCCSLPPINSAVSNVYVDWITAYTMQ